MGNCDDSLSFVLFARPSFVEGMGRAIDFGGTLQTYNDSETTDEADHRALSSDWRMIGRDIKAAICEHDKASK